MRNLNRIVIHCSDSTWGTGDDIHRWHLERGWDGIGYHFVITNGRAKSTDSYIEKNDGILQNGRPVTKVGAHVQGHNGDSIGICLIGTHWFSSKQLQITLPNLLTDLMFRYKIPANKIYGHFELDENKTCPNIDMTALRHYMEEIIVDV